MDVLSSINEARKDAGLKLLVKEERKCLKCDKKFKTISRNLCKSCRDVISRKKYSDDAPYSYRSSFKDFVYY